MTYDQYRAKVSAVIARKCGLSIDDLPDTDTYSAFEDGATPSECAAEVLEYAGFPG